MEPKSWMGVGMAPFHRRTAVSDIFSGVNPAWHVRYEFIMKLLMRMQKYDRRGIEILDCPGAENVDALTYPADLLSRR